MPNAKIKLLVGADPELFLRDSKTGALVAAKIPGTKLEPYKVPSGAIQVDGTAAEFNIDPAGNHVTFVQNIKAVMTHLKSHTQGLDFVLDPTVTFEPTYFKSLPDEVRELGCNPDFNAWTGEVNPAPDGESTTMRTASGHIHVGWTKNVNPMDPMHFEDCRTVIKQLDYYLGLYSLIWDPDNKRRQLYGKAGAFRVKPYGAEYRTMSNVWLRSEKVQTWIFGAVTKAITDLLSEKPSMESQFEDFAQRMIDENQTKWYDTGEGARVHKAMGMIWPESTECINYKPAQVRTVINADEVKRTVKKKKSNPFHSYGESGSVAANMWDEFVNSTPNIINVETI